MTAPQPPAASPVAAPTAGTLAHPVDWAQIVGHDDIRALCALALREDLGAGDVTTDAIFTAPQRVRAQVVARTSTVVCGMPLIRHVLTEVATRVGTGAPPEVMLVELDRIAPEGADIAPGGVLVEILADVRVVLAAERTLLNFAMRLCGIASGARRAMRALPAGSQTQVMDTRKTLPGWRRLEKAAVRTGGGTNHRMGLYDAVLIKDNHVAAAGGVTRAVQRARANVGNSVVVEVEVDTLAQLDEALAAAPDVILIDNFSLDDMREAVRRTQGRVPLEASGGVSLATLPSIAATGVERISMGALTHSAMPADLGLDFLP